jgi:hypothetical protein
MGVSENVFDYIYFAELISKQDGIIKIANIYVLKNLIKFKC